MRKRKTIDVDGMKNHIAGRKKFSYVHLRASGSWRHHGSLHHDEPTEVVLTPGYWTCSVALDARRITHTDVIKINTPSVCEVRNTDGEWKIVVLRAVESGAPEQKELL